MPKKEKYSETFEVKIIYFYSCFGICMLPACIVWLYFFIDFPFIYTFNQISR